MTEALNLHAVNGNCDICGDACDSATQELNALSCTFAQCGDQVYHQDCLEKFLKSIKCEKNRKTGFQCPRGRGKVPGDTCPGRIDKSHPIHPRNDANKKRKKVKIVEAAPLPPRFGPVAKAARQKERDEKDKALAAKQEAAQKVAVVAKATAATQSKVSKPQQVPDLQKQRAAAKALRREIMGGPLSPTASSHGEAPQPARELKTLDEYEASKATAPTPTAPAPPSFNAWAAKGDKPLAEKNGARLNFSQAFPAMPAPPAGKEKSKPKDAPAATERQRREPPPQQPQQQQQQQRQQQQAAGQRGAEAQLDGPQRADQPGPQQAPFWQMSQALFAHPPPPPSESHPGSQHQGTSDACLPSISSFSSSAAQHAARAHVSPIHTSVCASSLSSQHSTSSLQSSLLLAEAPCSGLPGATFADADAGEQKLTKAQKKNLKRAEKKARQGGASGEGSVLGPTGGADASATLPCARESGPSQSPLLHACLTSLARFKMLCCLHDLVSMGFDDVLCVAAIQRKGTDVESAIDWLVNHQSSDEPLELHDYAGPAMLVDVSVEMAAIEEALALLSVSPWAVHQTVVDCHGNLYEALCKVLQNTTLGCSGGSAWGSSGVPADGRKPGWHVLGVGSHRGVPGGDSIPEAALMNAAAIAQDADAGANQGANFDALLAGLV